MPTLPRLFCLALVVSLLTLWLLPPLLPLSERAMLRGQEADADALLAATPFALFAPIRVGDGPDGDDSGRWNGRYLTSGLYGQDARQKLEREGWNKVWQGGNTSTYERGNQRLSIGCVMFSRLYSVCNVYTRLME